MDTEQIFSIISEKYGLKIAQAAVFPEHFGIPNVIHSRGGHSTANNEEIEFFLNIDEDNTIESCWFTAHAAAIAIASAEAICHLAEGIRVDMLHKVITEDSVIEFLETEIPDSDMLGVFLAQEAFRKCLLNLIPISRDPWKRFYTKPFSVS
ncbi:iron-sulfur cluster assembly scaffold protein [Myxococcota bacterium]|nr:iron-sulfur cluster assembly scaffold protein [Myxococcota bacterium]MBU1381804.1 iron-sulfur cluster assembly scaffold protein [Myxococcota bacterium]MBU1498581.1 iron-sulfur cluster assembly scaffold protein [Myxococcota bacterium]